MPPLSLAVTQHSLTCARSVLQSCPALCNPMDRSPPDLSVHGTFQAKILEWVAISFFRGSSRPRARICISCVSCIAGRFFTAAPPGKHIPSLLLFSHPVMSNSLQPHGLQHTKPPCPSASPKFPGGASWGGKNPPVNAGHRRDVGSIPGSGRFPGEGHGNPPQYSCLENPMDRGAWQATSIGSQRVRHN